MGIINKKADRQSKRRNTQKLKSEIDELKKIISHSSDDYFKALILFAKSENTDVFLYNPKNQQLTNLSPGKKSLVFGSVLENLESIKQYIHSEDLTLFNNIFSQIDTEIAKSQIRFSIQRESKTIEIITILLEQEDKKALVFLKDISIYTKQQREINKHREKIEESDKLKTLILSNISHYVRTPLNSITGFSELLASTHHEPDRRKEYIDIIKRQSKRILDFIDDISEIAKLESGKVSITKNKCNLNLVLNELKIGLNQLQTQKRKEQVKLIVTLPDNEGVELYSDSGRIQQALFNVLNYSFRHTKTGEIEFGYTIDLAERKVNIFTHDTSDGLSKEEQKTVFNKFTIIDSNEGKLEDPNLGLTISRAIVKALGGKIWVESELNKGTSFYISLPFEPAFDIQENIKPAEYEIETFENFNWPNKVILIVDDEDINAKFLEAVFLGTSVQTIFAKNGREAIELVKSINKIDLILMDLKMPVLNGIRATIEIRKINQTIPIIAQTALSAQEEIDQCLSAGCNATIIKPIEVEELLQLANKYLSA